MQCISFGADREHSEVEGREDGERLLIEHKNERGKKIKEYVKVFRLQRVQSGPCGAEPADAEEPAELDHRVHGNSLLMQMIQNKYPQCFNSKEIEVIKRVSSS